MDSPHDPSAAAEQARARLHEEIERVRVGVEEMLSEQDSDDADLRRELDAIRKETRKYVKRRIRKTEKRLFKQITRVEDQTRDLELRLNQVEEDRKQAEWRIHTNTEQMLDGLLHEIRAIADLLTRAR